jgi:2',3'-cyclic-nucleotide 2'-phosphodiesterase (5'-nucleotidase family)/predicted AlkP superfamily phosphohydrolase/phosphomutase
MKRRRWLAPALCAAAAFAIVLTIGAGSATAKKGDGRPVDKVVLFSSDGMRPDLMEKYAKDGLMPTYKALMKDGATGKDGMLQAFPPNTGVGWYTLATGTYPSEHGSTNNTFFRTGDSSFNNSTSFSASGILQADTLAASAERAGKKVAQIEWTGGRNAGIKGPTVDYLNFFSGRGVLTYPSVPSEAAGAASFGLQYQIASFAPASGWTNLPASTLPAKESVLTVPTTFAAQNPTRVYDVLVYAAGAGYDHVLLVRQSDGKDASKAVANLPQGVFKEIKVTGPDGLIGARAGETAGFYVKLIDVAGDLSSFKLYFTSVARVIATCDSSPGGPCAGLPAGISGEDRLEKYIADNLPTAIDADFAPEEAGIIDEDTYVEQGRDLEKAYGDAVLSFVLGTLQPDTELALVGYPFTDEASHQFMGLVSKKDPDGKPNPCYDVMPKFDDVECTGTGTAHRVDIREGYIRSAYATADEKLALARQLMGGNPTTFAVSDHGFGAQRYAVNATKVLFDATVHNTVTNTDVSLHASNANASNCRAAATDLAKACWAGGTIQIYVNTTLPAGITYEAVRTAAIGAFQNLTDPANPGKQVILKILKKEDLRDVDGSDSLHPNRSGDVVVVTAPPYQSDAGTNGVAIALSHFFGQHGYLPDYVSDKGNVDMHATFVAGGPLIRHKDNAKDVRAVDVAPTIAFLMDIPGPLNARGNILYDVLDDPAHWKEATILYISDFHGQLTPLAQTADSFGPSFSIGGAAFMKPWFDRYGHDAVGKTLLLSGGDAVGASPPISNFFGDVPTMNVLNMLGLDADTLGNHNFDRGSQYLRETLIPIAKFPYLSANAVFASNGKLPKEWDASHVFNLPGGFKLGVIGYTLPELPTLIFPGYLDPFVITDPVAAVNAEAAKLGKKVDAVVAVGHIGGDGTVVTAPTGELMDFANGLTGVDVALGGHTHAEYITTATNGVLVAESPNAGTQFTRIRVVVDTKANTVVYKTADFHKMWDIGVTPDKKIDGYIADLNTQLAPIFNTVIGSSTKAIPRADQCGRSDGRLCESLIGDVATDALRTTYGTDFAITNSGGLRADLTCPTADNPGDFCPPFTPPPYPISRGQVLAVLPFGNVVFTVSLHGGAELKTFLENGVSLMPSAQGRFPQVSGLCFTYDIAAPAGNRVTSAVRQAADGSCTGASIDLTTSTPDYTIAENDFMATGGDGYPNVYSRGTTQNLMDQVVADYVTANSPLAPTVQAFPNGRVNCADSNGVGTAPDCPVLVPSP